MTVESMRSGFTLIEVLAVVLIAGLIAGLVTFGSKGLHQIDDVGLHGVQSLEDRIRSAAREGHGLTLRQDHDGWIVMDNQGRRCFELEKALPPGGRYWDRAGRPLTAFTYDRCGFSLDAKVRVAHDGQPHLANLDGITGEVQP